MTSLQRHSRSNQWEEIILVWERTHVVVIPTYLRAHKALKFNYSRVLICHQCQKRLSNQAFFLDRRRQITPHKMYKQTRLLDWLTSATWSAIVILVGFSVSPSTKEIQVVALQLQVLEQLEDRTLVHLLKLKFKPLYHLQVRASNWTVIYQ